MTEPSIVVVGGSVAGVSAADTLRVEGFTGTITVIGDEPDTAYSRPALSKGILQGTDDARSIRLPALDAGIEVRTATRAVALDTGRRVVTVERDGQLEELRFDGLVIATGARARRLDGAWRSADFVLRTLRDSLALRSALRTAASAVIVGGGFLALELAASLRGLGLRVTVVHTVPPLSRQLGPTLAGVIVDSARAAGVAFVAAGPSGARAPSSARALSGTQALSGGAHGVVLAGGEVLTADIVVSAIGDLPNVEWLAGSGLPHDGPLEVTPGGLVAPGIVAAGDVTATRLGTGEVVRFPHWHSAIAQGRAAARTLLGLTSPVPVPYCWTEGFGVELKVAGCIPSGVEPTVLEGSLPLRQAVVQWRGPDGTPVAAATVNHRLPLVKLRRLAEPTPTRPTLTEVIR